MSLMSRNAHAQVKKKKNLKIPANYLHTTATDI